MDKMKTGEHVTFYKKIAMINDKGVSVNMNFENIRGERRDRIGELVDQFLDSVVEILKEEIS